MFVYFNFILLFRDRRLQQASSVDDQGKDKDASFRDDAAEVTITLMETTYCKIFSSLSGANRF